MPARVLSRYERRIVRSFAEVLIPLDPAGAEMTALLERIDEHLATFSPGIRLAWRGCLIGLELIAFFYYGKCRPMSCMGPELRRRYVEAFHHTRWSVKRAVKRFLEAVVFMNEYSLPAVERRIGYMRAFTPAGGARDFPSANLVRDFPATDERIDADVCVIGTGAGGAFAAMELAEKGRRVVLLEEGDFFDVTDFGEDPVTMTRRLYRGGGLVNTLGWPPILVPLGRCVGGTTVINSGTCFRTPASIFHWWGERFGLSAWAPERLDSLYARVEQILEVEAAHDAVQGRSNAVFARGAEKLGASLYPVLRNASGCCGSGVCCFGCPTNAKKSLQMNAVPLALQAGATLFARCCAHRIELRGRHAARVHARYRDPLTGERGPRLSVDARAIVVACGTLHTPVLLARSGVPDPSGQRGRNLTLHPASKVIALMSEDVCGWKGIPQGVYSDVLGEEGIKLEAIFLPPAYTASTILTTGAEHRAVMEQYNRLAAFGMMVSDTTRGRVLRGLGGRPVVLYTLNRQDLAKYQRGIAYLAEAFFAAGAERVFPGLHTLPVVTREEGAATIANLRVRNKDLDLQAFHPLGTCRMGADPREAVVDPEGRVYGVDNLFVADGSIFPTALGVNPQMTIMAAALKIANHIDREVL